MTGDFLYDTWAEAVGTADGIIMADRYREWKKSNDEHLANVEHDARMGRSWVHGDNPYKEIYGIGKTKPYSGWEYVLKAFKPSKWLIAFLIPILVIGGLVAWVALIQPWLYWKGIL